MPKIVKAPTAEKTPAQILVKGKITPLPAQPKPPVPAAPVELKLTKEVACPKCYAAHTITMAREIAEHDAFLAQHGIGVKYVLCQSCEKGLPAVVAQPIVVRSWYQRNCPAEFQKPFDTALAKNVPATEEVLRYDYTSGKGLVIVGESRRGKTRAVWLLLQRLDQQKIACEAWVAEQWALECSRRIGESMSLAIDWLKASCAVPVFFMDDLDKLTVTDRVQSELFYLINNRCQDNKPTIITTNCKGDELAVKFERELGNALVGRMRDESLFTAVSFG